MVGCDLEVNGGTGLVPGGMCGEDFDAGVECGVGELLDVAVNDLGDGVPDPG